MTQCDTDHKTYKDKYNCYLNITRKSRENKACMYS